MLSVHYYAHAQIPMHTAHKKVTRVFHCKPHVIVLRNITIMIIQEKFVKSGSNPIMVLTLGQGEIELLGHVSAPATDDSAECY